MNKKKGLGSMYRKTPKGWLKHWDFIILEFVVLQISYFVAYLIRHGINDVFQTDSYRISALIILFVDVFTLFFFDSLKDVANRGYLKELTATVKHNFIVVAVCALVLFVFKRSEEISRFVVLYAGCINVVLTFLTRIIYKKILKKVLSKRMYKTLLIISSKEKIEKKIKKYTSLEINTFHVVGLVITDDATMVGQEIEGIPVVCSFVDSPDYAGFHRPESTGCQSGGILRSFRHGNESYPDRLRTDISAVRSDRLFHFLSEGTVSLCSASLRSCLFTSSSASFIQIQLIRFLPV